LVSATSDGVENGFVNATGLSSWRMGARLEK
jgi:hypothetical protein